MNSIVEKELASLFQEQIYKKHTNFSNVKYYTKGICEITDSIESKLEHKCICFIHYINKLLLQDTTKGESILSQIITLKYNDINIQNYISTDRQVYYKILNHLLACEFLIKYKGSSYLVNPYYIRNISDKGWKQMQSEYAVNKQKDVHNYQAKIMSGEVQGTDLIPKSNKLMPEPPPIN